MNLSLQKTINETFLQTLTDLGDKQEIFLKDLMGQENYEKLVKKLAIVYWIRKKRPMDIIKNNLEVTGKEIKDVEKLMDKKGIKLAIKYMEAEEFANVWSKRIKSVVK